MKFNVNFALRVAAAVVISAAASHAFAAGGLFDGGLFKGFSKSAPAASDGFFAGEALDLGDLSPGYTLLCCRGKSLGWGKQAGGLMKNHYPKGLRRRQDSLLYAADD